MRKSSRLNSVAERATANCSTATCSRNWEGTEVYPLSRTISVHSFSSFPQLNFFLLLLQLRALAETKDLQLRRLSEEVRQQFFVHVASAFCAQFFFSLKYVVYFVLHQLRTLAEAKDLQLRQLSEEVHQPFFLCTVFLPQISCLFCIAPAAYSCWSQRSTAASAIRAGVSRLTLS